MAKDFKITDYGDLYVDPDTHDFVLIDGIDEIAQRIKATLETFLGEMDIIDPDQGMDYTNFLGHNYDKVLASRDLRETIQAKVPEVDSVDDIELKVDPSTRHLNVHFKATATPTESSTSQPVEGDVDVGL